MTTREAARSLQRYGGALASGLATAELHHHQGHESGRTSPFDDLGDEQHVPAALIEFEAVGHVFAQLPDSQPSVPVHPTFAVQCALIGRRY